MLWTDKIPCVGSWIRVRWNRPTFREPKELGSVLVLLRVCACMRVSVKKEIDRKREISVCVCLWKGQTVLSVCVCGKAKQFSLCVCVLLWSSSQGHSPRTKQEDIKAKLPWHSWPGTAAVLFKPICPLLCMWVQYLAHSRHQNQRLILPMFEADSEQSSILLAWKVCSTLLCDRKVHLEQSSTLMSTTAFYHDNLGFCSAQLCIHVAFM